MKTHRKNSLNPPTLRQLFRMKPTRSGHVLLYVVILILIFGILGVVMVSLFTTSTASSVTQNDSRRALYMYESGMRYAFSEIRKADFDQDFIDNTLNTTTYNVADAGSFTINVFSPWFESPSVQSSSPYTLTITEGTLPTDFDVPANLWVFNLERMEVETDYTPARTPVTAYTRIDDTTLRLNMTGDFNVSPNNRVCVGVQPSHTQNNPPLQEGDDLYVERVARDFFPRLNGAININRVDYSYDRLVDEPGNNRVRLENLSASRFQNTLPAFPLTVEKTTDGGGTYTGEFIVLSPRNHMVIPTGISESVTHGGDYRFGMNIYDTSPGIPAPPDIDADEFTSNITQKETSENFIGVDTGADTLNVGGDVAPGANAEFGAGWYDADKTIGSDVNFCQAGKCKFGLGVRVFFILKFIGGNQGDGFTFALMNGEGRDASNNFLNDVNSVGGDFELSELMGYAGDSRTADGEFLDPTNPRGIQPPKLAIEFDTQTNFDAAFESEPEPKDYCIDLLNLKPNTRNDPSPGNSDAVQYVFWGDSSLNVLCRSSNPSASVDTYDGNRHGTIEAPINDRTIAITSKDELDSGVTVDDPDDWLNGDNLKGPWAVRIEIERSTVPNAEGKFDYSVRTWIRQCQTDANSSDCTDASILVPKPYQDTRLKYDFSPVPDLPLTQQIELVEEDHDAFERFLFGFTGAAGSESLNVTISEFQLSFIRLGDPVVVDDSVNWPP